MRTLPFIALMLTTLSVAPTFAKAGAGSSGGGNALVCFDTPEIPKLIRERDQAGNIIDGSIRNEHIKHITRLEVLDLVEAQFARGMSQPKLSDLIQLTAGEDVEEYSRRIIERLKNVAPLLYDNLMNRLNEMPASEATAQPDGLYPVDDYNLLGRIDSTNCVVATVAVHQFSSSDLKGSPQLYFDQRLMYHPKHSEFSKAVTYLHEVVYSYARSNLGHGDSQDSRKLIGLLLRKKVDTTQLEKMINESNFNDRNRNFVSFNWAGRTDRLGYLYFKLNSEASHKILFESSDAGKGLSEEYNEKAIKEMNALVKCSNIDSCFWDIKKISEQSSIFAGAKKVKSAKLLVSKYADRDNDRAMFVNKGSVPAYKKILKDLYENTYQDQLLAISNVPSSDLKKIDAAIEYSIENQTYEMVEQLRKLGGFRVFSGAEIFSEAGKLLKNIPQQSDL